MKSRIFAGLAATAMAAAGLVAGAPSAFATSFGGCTGGTLDWVHLYYNAQPVFPGNDCIGGIGTTDSPDGFSFLGFCGGNNYGYIKGHNDAGTNLTQDFGPSGNDNGSESGVYWFNGNESRFPNGVFFITSVTITKFSGPDDCPQTTA